MKIALTLLSGVGYGGATYFKNLIPALAAADRENEYHLFLPQGHPLIQTVAQKNLVFHECVRRHPSALERFWWEQMVLPRRLRQYKIELLFTAKNLNIFLAPCKTVIALRNLEPLAYREYDNDWRLNIVLWVKWQLTRWSVRKASHVVAVSQAVKERLIGKFPGIEKKVSVIYNGNPVLENPKSQIPNPKQIANSNDQSFILTASKFVAYANQLNLLKGYARLAEMNTDTPPLWFAGGVHDQKYFQKVQKFVQDSHLESRVKFLGLVPHAELLKLMAGARAFVFPSTLESCPHTLIEAMACGVPLAASRTPPMPEICADAALYFDPHNPEDIARVMERGLREAALREQLRSKGLARAQFFSWEKTARGLLEIFKRV